jgi:DNA-binding transcriptional MocR family regulator
VSKTTVMVAVEDLCVTGELVARPRAGLFFRRSTGKPPCTESQAEASNYIHKPGSAWHVPALYATPSFLRARALFRKHLDWSALHAWVPEAGMPRLRRLLAESFPPPGAPPPDPECVLLTGGVQEAILLALVTLRSVTSARVVYVESPGWQGASRLAVSLGFEVRALPRRVDGYAWAGIADACLADPPAAFVASPHAHNPLGTCLSASDRFELAALARHTGAYVIEDDCLRHTVVAAKEHPIAALPSLAALLPEQTFYIDGFRKILGPEYRLASLVVPPLLRERTTELKGTFRLCASGILQELLVVLCESDAFERHKRELGAEVERATRIFERQVKAHADVVDLAPGCGVIWPYRRVRLRDPAKATVSFAALHAGGIFVSEDDAFFSDAPLREPVHEQGRWMRFNVTRSLSGEVGAALALLRRMGG